MSSSAIENAVRYLAEGRLHIEYADGRTVRATCLGRELYRLGFDGYRWTCDCPARRGCAHLTALERVTVQRASDGFTPRQLAEAHAHARFHAVRTGETAPPPPPRYLTVGNPPRLVYDYCWRCDHHGPIAGDGTCGECVGSATTD